MALLIHALGCIILQFDLTYQYFQHNSSNLSPTPYHFCEINNIYITTLHGIIERRIVLLLSSSVREFLRITTLSKCKAMLLVREPEKDC